MIGNQIVKNRTYGKIARFWCDGVKIISTARSNYPEILKTI
jgi:hypothetical protein